MKRQYIRSDEHLKRKREASKFTETDIAQRSREAAPNGDSMALVFNRIMKDPDVVLGKKTRRGYQTIYFKGKDIGWVNERGVGWIDDNSYDLLAKNEGPQHTWISSLKGAMDWRSHSDEAEAAAEDEDEDEDEYEDEDEE